MLLRLGGFMVLSICIPPHTYFLLSSQRLSGIFEQPYILRYSVDNCCAAGSLSSGSLSLMWLRTAWMQNTSPSCFGLRLPVQQVINVFTGRSSALQGIRMRKRIADGAMTTMRSQPILIDHAGGRTHAQLYIILFFCPQDSLPTALYQSATFCHQHSMPCICR
jgi:hypothetical protein